MTKKATRKKKTPVNGRSRESIKETIERSIRKEFPKDTVDVSDGYRENIHVLVVSRRFDDLDHQSRQDMLWNIIDKSGLADEDIQRISLMLPLSPADIK